MRWLFLCIACLFASSCSDDGERDATALGPRALRDASSPEVLDTLSGMSDGDHVVIDFRSGGCFSRKTAQLTIHCSQGRHTVIVNSFESTRYGTILPAAFVPLRLTPEQLAGVDNSIAAFRAPPESENWTHRERLELRWFRRGEPVRSEDLSDSGLRHLNVHPINLHTLIDEAWAAGL